MSSEVLERIRAQYRANPKLAGLPSDVLRLAAKRFAEKVASDPALRDEFRRRQLCRQRAIGPRGQFDFFLRHYFAHYFTCEFGDQQRELIRLVQSYRGKAGRAPLRSSVALSRGFGKSTILSLCGLLWLVLTRTWVFPVLISSNLDAAKEFLQKVIDETEDNPLLTADFPELQPARDRKNQFVSWRDTDIVFACGARVLAKGFLNAIRGKRYRNFRPDALVIDDPDEERDVVSESTMRRKYRWLERAALRLGTAWGIDVFLAYTTISPNCIGEYVFTEAKYSTWTRRKYRAIEVDSDGNEYSTWEAGAPLKTLLLERDGDGTDANPGDPLGFSQERQNETVAEADQKFKGLIRTYDFEPPPDWSGWRLAICVDLSLGRNQRSDYSAIVGVGRDPAGVVYELFSDIARRRPDVIMADYYRALLLFPWQVAGVGEGPNEEYFTLNFRKYVQEQNRTRENKVTCPVVGVPNVGDKDTRIIGSLQYPIAAGHLLLRKDSRMLYQQLDVYPYGYKDGPDALEMAHGLLDRGVVQTPKVQTRSPESRTARGVQGERYRNMLRRPRSGNSPPGADPEASAGSESGPEM